MKKKSLKVKESVRLRMKNLANGNKSLYLDIYQNGSRSYRFLKLYIVPEHSLADRAMNRETMSIAEMMKANKTIELLRSRFIEPKDDASNNTKLVDLMRSFSLLKKEKGQSEEYSRQIDKALRYVIKYGGENLTLSEVDKDFCLGFLRFLKSTPLSAFSKINYFSCFKCTLTHAVREGILPTNPAMLIPVEERLKMPESKRNYLTIKELESLVDAECKNETVKRSYMFSCMCGLRFSDVNLLRWGDLYLDGSQWRVNITMKKTQKQLYMPVSPQAMVWLPQRKPSDKDTDTIFHLPSNSYMNRVLHDWAEDSGIHKRLSFHTARHTFATMMLTVGSDLYTLSKLMGHSQVKTTQIYARIVDKKKDEAVKLIPIFKKP